MAGFNLRKYIRSEQAKDSTLLTKLAKIAGYASTSPIVKWLDDPKRELGNFNSFIAIVRYLFPDQKYEILKNYAKTICPTKKTSRDMLEYASFNKLDKLRDCLIKRLIESENKESNEWSKVYLLESQLEGEEIEVMAAFNLITEYNVKSLEMKAFTKIIIMNGFYELKNYKSMFEVAKVAKEEIIKMKDTFIKNSYRTRLCNVLSIVSLHNGELEKAREYSDLVLESTNKPIPLSLAHLHIGQSYIFDNYDLAYKHLKEALKLSVIRNNEAITIEIKRSINFLDSYWGNEGEFLNRESTNTHDIQDIIFDLIRKGDNDSALRILDDIDNDIMCNSEKGFHYYYRGLITKNKEDYYKSIQSFNLIGDKFSRKAPIIELEKLGENRILLEILST